MRTYPDRPILGVGAVIFDRGRVLLIKRAHEPLKGEWSLPGGAVDVGEALHAAVVREVAEETGLDVDIECLVEVVERITHDEAGRVQFHFVIADYLCRPTGGRLASASDADAAEWADLDDLGRFHLTQSALNVIRQALSIRGTSAPQHPRT
jgi:mutator protein MutT